MNRCQPLAVVFGLVTLASSGSVPEPPVWSWFSACGGPVMELEVRLDQSTIVKTSFPICQAFRESDALQGQAVGSLQFTFRPGREMTWSGYRDTADHTNADELLTCDIWQAGADSDHLAIGVAFRTAAGIHMNTLHIAHPAGADETKISGGLTVVSRVVTPASASKP